MTLMWGAVAASSLLVGAVLATLRRWHMGTIGLVLAFGAGELYAADRTRCHQTLEPLAQELGTAVTSEPELTEEAYADDKKAA